MRDPFANIALALKSHVASADTRTERCAMHEPGSDIYEQLLSLTDKIALELRLAAPGKDEGLLPIHSFLSEMEDATLGAELPTLIQDALQMARGWVNAVFESFGAFDPHTLQRLNSWAQWMQIAFAFARTGVDLPPWPDAFLRGSTAAAPAAKPKPAETQDAIILNIARDADLLRDFITEAEDHLQAIESGALKLESDPADAETLNEVFRGFHTLKGSSAFLELDPINQLSHDLESLLDSARQKRLEITAEVINVILKGADTLHRLIEEMSAQVAGEKLPEPIAIPTNALREHIRAVVESHGVDSGLSVNRIEEAERDAELQSQREAIDATQRASTQMGVVKVDTHKLDELVDLAGELGVIQSVLAKEVTGLSEPMARFARVTKDIRRLTTSLRMAPIRPLFKKLTRVVQDVARQAGKEVALTTSGEETELDRKLIEELSDPLIHLIRNAIDHGIEPAEERRRGGKPAMGRLMIDARHAAGRFVIQVRDDGSGLNRERILAKAVERGLTDGDAPLSDGEVYDFIFQPGFSTCESVSEISGRGVGMDIVRANVELLRGRIELTTEAGKGTTFTITAPLSLALVEGLIVGVGDNRFVLPTANVREVRRAHPQTSLESNTICRIGDRDVPVMPLAQAMGFSSRHHSPGGILVVTQFDAEIQCLSADCIIGRQDVVIKSLGDLFPPTAPLLGASVLADGKIGFIIDIPGLFRSDSLRKTLQA